VVVFNYAHFTERRFTQLEHSNARRHPSARSKARRSTGITAVAAALAVVLGGWASLAAPSAAEANVVRTPAEPSSPPEVADASEAPEIAESSTPTATPPPSSVPDQPSTQPAAAEEPTTEKPEPATTDPVMTSEPDPHPVSSASPEPGLPGDHPVAESSRGPPTTAGTDVQATATRDASIFAAGVPETTRQVWIESFEQGLTTAASGLPSYSASKYTASTGWRSGTSCTGVLVNYTAPYPNAAFCPTQPLLAVGQSSLAARDARRMADVLGQVSAGVVGSTSATTPTNGSTAGTQSNHALVSIPYATVAGGTTVLQSVAGTGISAADSRFYAVGMNAVGAQCGTNNASLSLNLVSGATTLLSGFPTPVIPCTRTGSVYYTSPALPTLATISGILDPAWSASVRAGASTGTNTALLTPAQISTAQAQIVNTVTGVGSGFGVDNIRVLDVTPALDAAFDSTTATATVPTTLTYTITNTTDLFAKTDWGFSTALPSGMSVAPTPAVTGTCTNAAGTAFGVTAAAGSSSISVLGGDLAAGTTSCTISVAVVAASAGTYTSGSVTPSGLITSAADNVTVAPATTITVRKNLPGRSAPTDQFTLSLRTGTTVLASATTTGTATGIQAAQVTRSVVQPGSTYTIHEAQTSGAGLGYSNAYECTRAGNVIASGAGASGTITVPDEVGAEVVCTFTNTVQAARLFCDANHFYSMTAAGALEQGDIVSGSLAQVGSWTGVTAANGLGIGAGGNLAYALDRSTDASDVASILKWTAASLPVRSIFPPDAISSASSSTHSSTSGASRNPIPPQPASPSWVRSPLVLRRTATATWLSTPAATSTWWALPWWAPPTVPRSTPFPRKRWRRAPAALWQ
jgi:hypothetical protein